MKALSIKQPFAELILQGRKKIELRNWNTKFRGKFLIHSPLKPDKKAMKKFEFPDLPCGFILGEAEIVEVKRYSSKKEHNNDKNLHLADSSWGTHGFVLKNQRRINLIPAKGKLGFWEFNQQGKKL